MNPTSSARVRSPKTEQRPLRALARAFEEARRAVEEFGIRVLCVKAADRRGWRQDVENFVAIRDAVGDGVEIGVDPNTGWTVGDSLLAIHAMRQYDLGYIEQPIDRRDLRGLAEIRRQAQGIPVIAGQKDRA